MLKANLQKCLVISPVTSLTFLKHQQSFLLNVNHSTSIKPKRNTKYGLSNMIEGRDPNFSNERNIAYPYVQITCY